MPIDPDAIPDNFPPMFSPHSVDATNALSLGDARKWLRYRAMQKGSQCPCCGGFTRFYERRINKTMARCLGWLAHISGPDLDWVEVPKKAPRWLLRSNQLATLRHWNLVEKQESVESKGKASGIWRPTQRGYEWATGSIQIPKFVAIYKGDTLARYGPLHSFSDAVASEYFDYEKTLEPAVYAENDALVGIIDKGDP